MTEKEKTAPVVSVGADTEQSILKQINNSITDFNENDKSLDDYLEEIVESIIKCRRNRYGFSCIIFYPKAGGRRLKH